MDIQEVAKRDGKARRTMNVNESTYYIDSDYVIDMYDNNKITNTGLLTIANLHKNKHLTTKSTEFLFRWDGKTNTLDIDPCNALPNERAKFKKGTRNYSGHHPKKLPSGGWEYECKIIWGGKQLYHGKIGFNLAREVAASTGIAVKPSASYEAK